jgi:hypothetical protein
MCKKAYQNHYNDCENDQRGVKVEPHQEEGDNEDGQERDSQ